MKVLIVDDETDVRDSIRLLVQWEDFQITDVIEACDGAAAMELIRSEQPEIIFTDMKMPNVDGLTLLQWIGDHAPESKRIVISGYDDYTYIRKTMRHGGLDYLLKPINRNELLEALRNAVDTWLKDDEARLLNIRRDVEINKTLPMYWDKMLSGVVSQPDGYSIVADELQASFEWSAVRECQLVMLISDPLPRTVLEKFGRNIDLLYFLMLNICNEVIGSSRNGYAFKHADPNYGILLLLTGDFGGNSRKLTAINEALYHVLGARFHFACSGRVSFPQDIHTGFQQMLHTALSVSFLGPNTWIHSYDDIPAATSDKRIVLADYSSSISAAIHKGEQRQIKGAVANWVQAIEQLHAVTWEQLKYWRYEFEMLRSHLLQDTDRAAGETARTSSQWLFPIGPDGRLSLEEWQKEWTNAFLEIAEVLKDSRLQEYDVIHSIKQYIDLNYMHDLSLQEIASQFFLSREYVSRRFKQVFHENQSEYLERVRIENAKILLMNKQYKIASIAERVGYPDGRYFSKIFNKLTGMTPREWRKEAGGEGGGE
ncbi:hypothetical protein A3844_10840 [Paenibacillus helianthi]|uniref:DNA-binding response regulator n=1 Tax=Paenibacillus helianthi TaxID=1349432 RepID=A0ABX3ET10_9BACL|nr:response regulator [Paenibacillus helianthi]OKP87548.1 hypothetical protein A3844_10840 [Paenibacillus helianthi]